MKPSFALDFRDGLVTLLHRTSRGWSQVGSTSFDAPDMAEALGYMRSTALGLSPRGITTKLIIPNDQILYTGVHAPGPDAAKRKRQIKAGLEGRTPYAVDDLVYDWWGTGPDLNVAVIAKETLAEAEGFATEHRFNPVSFVAVADNGVFLGEPFFGPSALAATLMSDGEKVERDSEPVTIIARDFNRSEAKAKSVEPLKAVPEDADEDAGAELAQTPDSALVEPELEAEAEPAVEITKAVRAVAEELIAQPAVVAHARENEVRPEVVQPIEAALPRFEPVVETPSVEPARDPTPVARQARPQSTKPVVLTEAPEAPMAMDVASDGSAEPGNDLPPAPAAQIVAAFATRRSAAIAAATAGTTKPASAAGPKIPAVGSAPAQRPTVPRPNFARPAPASARDTLPFPAKTNGTAAKAAAGKPSKPSGASVTAAGIVGVKRERNVVPLPTAGIPAEQSTAALKIAAKPPTGLGSRAAPIKGKPRYLGLFLTVVLLVLLVAVAAWSSFFMGANDTTGTGAGTLPPTSPVASLSAPEPAKVKGAATASTTAPSATETATEPPQTQSAAVPSVADASSTTQSATTQSAATEVQPNRVAGDATPATAGVPSDAILATQGATAPAKAPETGVASGAVAAVPAPAANTAEAALPTTLVPMTPAVPAPEPAPKTEVSTAGVPDALPSTSAQDKIVLATADIPPKPLGPLAPPAIAAGADASPAAEPPLPPYGTVYKFDADGRIIPTPDGILTPEGVLLIAGKPKLAPPERPVNLTPAAPPEILTIPATNPTTGTAADAISVPVATGADAATGNPVPLGAPATEVAPAALVQDPTLVGKRPKDKPADLAPLPNQQGALDATTQATQFAGLHPAVRPKDLPATPLAPETGADAVAASASLAANGFALSTSLRPLARPSGLTRAVDTAVAAALQEAAPETPVPDTELASANVTPEAQAEPDTEAPAPDLPTNASVAKQATTRHALNTNRLALLAVFGTPSTRFAMIRQGNGTVTKIQVGDTVDGGRVAAITETSVQYQKGGRIVTLSLPTG